MYDKPCTVQGKDPTLVLILGNRKYMDRWAQIYVATFIIF